MLLALAATAQVAFADPVAEVPRVCGVTSPQEAKSLADKLYEQQDYQRAAVCYQSAGDLARANLAFLKAAGPHSEETARALKAQGDQAKALFATVGRAFHSSH